VDGSQTTSGKIADFEKVVKVTTTIAGAEETVAGSTDWGGIAIVLLLVRSVVVIELGRVQIDIAYSLG